MPESTFRKPLPPLLVHLSQDEIVTRLDLASRRGRLPGFEARPPGTLFKADAWGTPFDSDLLANGASNSDGTTLQFVVRMRRRLPLIFAVVLLLTAWPGVVVTDSMLRLWFGWYNQLTQLKLFTFGGFHAFTYVWYLPLTVLPLPWMWRGWMRRSRATGRVSALEIIAKIAGELGVEAPPEAAALIAPKDGASKS